MSTHTGETSPGRDTVPPGPSSAEQPGSEDDAAEDAIVNLGLRRFGGRVNTREFVRSYRESLAFSRARQALAQARCQASAEYETIHRHLSRVLDATRDRITADTLALTAPARKSYVENFATLGDGFIRGRTVEQIFDEQRTAYHSAAAGLRAIYDATVEPIMITHDRLIDQAFARHDNALALAQRAYGAQLAAAREAYDEAIRTAVRDEHQAGRHRHCSADKCPAAAREEIGEGQ